ncbi:MAG TPA: hypothetical protein VIF83_15160 [Gemmatimonadaceae bacterium]
MRLLTQVLALSVCLAAINPGVASAQGSASRQSRTQAIVASFNKSKHVVKEKHGVRVDKYKEIRSEPAVRANPATYSGTYEVADLGLILRLQVDATGRVTGTGEEPLGDNAQVMRRFTLANPRIDGALLTGTKVYASGSSQPFEGVFINRTSFESPTDTGVTVFGLGVLSSPVHINGMTVDKFFYELKR